MHLSKESMNCYLHGKMILILSSVPLEVLVNQSGLFSQSSKREGSARTFLARVRRVQRADEP
jgi:hypothetical protein